MVLRGKLSMEGHWNQNGGTSNNRWANLYPQGYNVQPNSEEREVPTEIIIIFIKVSNPKNVTSDIYGTPTQDHPRTQKTSLRRITEPHKKTLKKNQKIIEQVAPSNRPSQTCGSPPGTKGTKNGWYICIYIYIYIYDKNRRAIKQPSSLLQTHSTTQALKHESMEALQIPNPPPHPGLTHKSVTPALQFTQYVTCFDTPTCGHVLSI